LLEWVHRRALLEHFEWLAGSHLLEDALDEAMIAIALCARGYQWDLMEYGAAWRPASGVVEVYKLDGAVRRIRTRPSGEKLGADRSHPALPSVC
jgi:hypothetical protein